MAIGRVFHWSYRNARVRARLGTLSTKEQYEDMASMTLEGALESLLANPPAGIEWPFITGKGDAKVSARLYKSYEKHLLSTSRILAQPFREVFKIALEETLINDLKYLIRRIASGHQRSEHEDANYVALNNSSLSEDYSWVENFGQLSKALQHTPYFHPFTIAYRAYKQTRQILGFEVALDLDFHNRLDKAIKALPEPDKSITGRLFRKLCDLKNLVWILRYRFHFKLTEVEIFNYTLNQGFELDDDKVMELAKLSSVEDFVKAIQPLKAGIYVKELSGDKELSIPDIEEKLQQYREVILRETITTSPFGLAPFMVYLWLKIIERNRLERVITGLQLEMPFDAIVKSLQLPREVSVA